MGSLFKRWQTPAVVAIAGAIFFLALGFFIATNIEKPSGSKAGDIWVEGTGLTESQRNVPSFAPIADKLKGSVVRIDVVAKAASNESTSTTPTTTPDSTGTPSPDNPDGLPPDHPPLPEGFQQTSEGSGVIISKDGYILTNQHVIDNAETVTVHRSSGQQYTAKVIGSDARDDLALVKIDTKDVLPIAPLGDSDAMKVGDWVLAMGNPLGFEYSATVGVISGEARSLPSSNFRDFIQTDAAIYPGNSGGPLINLAGEVIAINTAVIPDTNLGFAVPINTAKDILPQLLSKGKVTRGYLGVSIETVTEMVTPPEGVQKGVYIAEIHPGAPAEAAGFKTGDVVVSFNGQPVETAEDLTRMVTSMTPGTKAKVGILRGGQSKTLDVTIGALPETLQ